MKAGRSSPTFAVESVVAIGGGYPAGTFVASQTMSFGDLWPVSGHYMTIEWAIYGQCVVDS
jgi:hypothetical protein